MASRRERRNQRHEVALLEPIVEQVEEKTVEKNFDSDATSEGARESHKDRAMHDSDDDNEEEHRMTYASVNDLHKGCYVMMKGGYPCKVVEIARSKQGRKYEDLYPSSKNVEVPEVAKIELEVQAIENNCLVVKQLKDGKPHAPIALPDDEMGEKIKSLMTTEANVVVQLQCAMGKEKIVMAREKRTR